MYYIINDIKMDIETAINYIINNQPDSVFDDVLANEYGNVVVGDRVFIVSELIKKIDRQAYEIGKVYMVEPLKNEIITQLASMQSNTRDNIFYIEVYCI